VEVLIVGFIIVVGILFLLKMVRVVPQGFEWTVERFGK
jgi:regulator of protease activity HflC (stomatin/prohibitin superfamily)